MEQLYLDALQKEPLVTRDTLYYMARSVTRRQYSNVVDVHIKNLRKKIAEDGLVIHSVRGLGYKLERVAMP